VSDVLPLLVGAVVFNLPVDAINADGLGGRVTPFAVETFDPYGEVSEMIKRFAFLLCFAVGSVTATGAVAASPGSERDASQPDSALGSNSTEAALLDELAATTQERGSARVIVQLTTDVPFEGTLVAWNDIVDRRANILDDQNNLAGELEREFQCGFNSCELCDRSTRFGSHVFTHVWHSTSDR
jgi:hypothetical protein